MACAWAGFTAYAISMIISYVIGQRYYPVNYPLGSMAFYTVIAAILYAAIAYSNSHFSPILAIAVNTIIIGLYLLLIIKREFPLDKLPVVGKYFRK
jgi:hypothetical protein